MVPGRWSLPAHGHGQTGRSRWSTGRRRDAHRRSGRPGRRRGLGTGEGRQPTAGSSIPFSPSISCRRRLLSHMVPAPCPDGCSLPPQASAAAPPLYLAARLPVEYIPQPAVELAGRLQSRWWLARRCGPARGRAQRRYTRHKRGRANVGRRGRRCCAYGVFRAPPLPLLRRAIAAGVSSAVSRGPP